jgi:DNA modification methylase
MTGTMIESLTVDKPWLMLGDCLERMAEIPDGIVDAVICDLPYGTTDCKWDAVIPFEPLWSQYNRVLKTNGSVVLTSAQPFTTALIYSNMKNFRYSWVWDKKTATGGALSKQRPMRAHEDVCVFSNAVGVYNPQMVDFSPDEIKRMRKHDFICKNAQTMSGGANISRGWFEGKQKFPQSVIRINGLAPASAEKKSGMHPTQKPVALIEYLVKTYSNVGGTVLDNCAGSFTTGVACVNTGRRFIGIERHEPYFDIGRRRIEAAIAATQPAPLGGLFSACKEAAE